MEIIFDGGVWHSSGVTALIRVAHNAMLEIRVHKMKKKEEEEA